MRYSILHTMTYSYDQPVQLDAHILRLRPRSDLSQSLTSCLMQISPIPQKIVETVELDGNAVSHLWFAPESLTQLKIQVSSQVETHRSNPFDYLMERWAVQLPIDYPTSLLAQLQPYLAMNGTTLTPTVDSTALHLAQELLHDTHGNTLQFLSELNQRIYTTCQYFIRETGSPQVPGITWTTQAGSCRDYAVLFMEVCRAVGLAARFVSGYHEGDPDSDEELHLHAWVEVYMPGAGWRGYDPTHGLAVGDRHIALVASAFPRYAAPLTGHLCPGFSATAIMDYQLLIQRDS